MVMTLAVGYGIGSSSAVALYRTASLLKSGRAEQNEFGQGIMAGGAVAFGLLSAVAVPKIMPILASAGVSQEALLLLGAVGLIAGFLQSRSSFVRETVQDMKND